MIHCSALVVVSWRYVSCMVLLIYSCRSVWAKADHGSQYTKFSFMENKTAARAINLRALLNYRDGPQGVPAAIKQDVVGILVPIMMAKFPDG